MSYFFLNWKMYLDQEETGTMLAHLLEKTAGATTLDIAVFPLLMSLGESIALCKDSSIQVGAQNIAWVPKGAYTGAISAAIVEQAGARYALVGHSERRSIFNESNEAIRKKMDACFDVGLTPVLCIGETKHDREEGKTEYRLKKQLMEALEGLDLNGKAFFVAYEPVWAIAGHGKAEACPVTEVAAVHALIREELKQYTQETVPLLFGGSVNAQNAVSYRSLADVDGLLVGSAGTTTGRLDALLAALA